MFRVTFQQLRLLNIKYKRRTQESCNIKNNLFGTRLNVFYFFYLLLSQKDLSSMWKGSWILLWSLFCSMSSIAGWYLLKRLRSTQVCSNNPYLKKFLSKLEKHLCQVYFMIAMGLQTIVYLKWIATHTFLEIWRRCSLQR